MRIADLRILNIATGEWEVIAPFEWHGPLWECKYDKTAQAAETQQMNFDAQLMDIFRAQYGNQLNVLNYLQDQLKPQIANPQGFTPEALAAMRTQAKDTTAAEFANAQRGANVVAGRLGGAALPSGVGAALSGDIAAEAAKAESTAQNNITLANANLRNTNYWNAISALSGNAQLLAPQSYASGATSGTNAVANTSEAVTQSNGPTIGQILGGIVGGVGGALVGNPALFGGHK